MPSLYNQVKRFGKPTWRRLVEAVEDPVGGNDSALALKIAAKHLGMQPYSNTGMGGTIFALSAYSENVDNY